MELRENFKISLAVTCFVSEKLSAIINVDRKQHTEMFHRSYSKKFCDLLQYESKTILFSKSPFTSPCEKFSKEFSCRKKSFIEPVEITLGIDPTTNKADTIQHVPILKTIPRVFQYEDVLSHCLNSEVSKNDDRIGAYYESENFKQNKLFNSPENSTETVLYSDDFNVVNLSVIR